MLIGLFINACKVKIGTYDHLAEKLGQANPGVCPTAASLATCSILKKYGVDAKSKDI